MSSETPAPAVAGFAISNRILAGSLMASLVFIALALYFVLGTQDDGLSAPPVWVPLAQVVAGVAVFFLLETIGYRVPALDLSLSEDDAAASARQVWSTTMILRFAFSEAIAIASVAGAFILTEGGYLSYLGGMLVSLVLMGIHVWPGARPVGKIADALEAGGRSSQLREVFGLPTSSGPIQRL